MDPYAPPSPHQMLPPVPAGGPTGPAAAAPVGYAPPPPPVHVDVPGGHSLVRPSAGPVLAAGAVTAGLLALIAVLMAGNAVVTSQLVAGGQAAVLEQLVSPSLGNQLLGWVPWLLQPLCGIAFAVWLLLALRNARWWGTPIRRGPGWAIGAWFVPVLNLWRPKHLVDDVWRGSHPSAPPGTPLQVVPRAGLGYLWWTTWLLAPALLYVGMFRAMVPLVEQFVAAAQSGAAAPVVAPAGDPAAVMAALPAGVDLVGFLESAAMWSLWAYVLWTVCALSAAVLVVQVSLWQRDRLRAVTQQD